MREGSELSGRYRLEALLGRGGMGQVWRGRDLELDRPVAIKLMLDPAHEEMAARFRREARTAARLHHPLIASVFDVGRHDGLMYLVLELVNGTDLDTVTRRRAGGLPVEQVVAYGAQIAEGLAVAHDAGIVHRDVKPGNIMVLDDGKVKICDFGIARVEGATAMTRGLIGSPAYMAPELFQGRHPSVSTDLYALGCTLYALLTGGPPFTGSSYESLIARILNDPAPDPGRFRPDVPAGLQDLIRELLAKNADDRPANARAVAARLRTMSVPSGKRHPAGIDLGTSHSLIAVLEGGKPTVVTNSEGSRTTPSVVAFPKTGGTLLGEPARRQATTNTDRTYRSVMREIGTAWTTVVDDRVLTSEQLIALILQKLIRDAGAYLQADVTDVVITVPVGSDLRQRRAIGQAARLAGLNVLRIISAPAAAGFTISRDPPASIGRSDDVLIMVFDLGGGTFDVSLLEGYDGVMEVKATSGDGRLGGDDWDDRVVDWLVSKFKNAHGVDLSKDKTALQRLREAGEKAKVELSSSTETTIGLPYITASAEGPLHLEEKLTRAEFQRLTSDLLERCKAPFDNVIRDAGIPVEDIDHVVLVGGSTRMPAVTELVKELSGKEPNRGVNPDEVVAAGAALQAGVLRGEIRDMLLLDAIPASLGIETRGGAFTRIINRNTMIPAKASLTVTTGHDDQASVLIAVYEGEHEATAHNKRLGAFQLAGLPPSPGGVPQIEVTFDIDANGIVNVSAKDLGTGDEQSLCLPDDASAAQAPPEDALYPVYRERKSEAIDLRSLLAEDGPEGAGERLKKPDGSAGDQNA